MPARKRVQLMAGAKSGDMGRISVRRGYGQIGVEHFCSFST